MTTTVRKILVIGGNGFIGSAVCKAALARGIQVTSVSSSGSPYRTAKGHSPAWTTNVDWQKGDALRPQSFAHLFPKVDGVVHTLGVLLENTSYKQAVRDGNVPGLLGNIFQSFTGNHGNPLKRGVPAKKNSGGGGGDLVTYESINRDSALRVCEAFISSPAGVEPDLDTNNPRPFIYLSAEDISRPVIPAGYIKTKREAERGIEHMISEHPSKYRGVYIRPSLVYHAHHRPLTTPAAALLDLSATLHRKMPRSIPTPSSILRLLGSNGPFAAASSDDTTTPSVFDSMANALVIPPIHVDHVAEAICVALDSRNGVKGVVGVNRMRELLGWSNDVSGRGS